MAGFGKGCHLQLIDGSGYIFRAYHALPPLTRQSDGLPIGAVAGFCNMVWKMLQETRGADAPTHVAVVFDKSEHTFRNELFPAYKAQRPPAPDDLVPQFRLIRDATRAFNLPCIEQEGFEADDLIATYATLARDAGGRVTIVSADKDLMQLVGPGIDMLDTLKNRRIGPDEVVEKFGVAPDRVIDVQALAGDSVDNVPGAPGIGIKTAAQLIGEYGDLDTLLARADEIRQPKRREALQTYADQIRVSRQLVTLKRDVALAEPLEALEVRPPEPATLMEFLATMEFRALLGRVSAKLGVEAPAVAPGAAAEAPVRPAEAAEPPAAVPIDPSRAVILRDGLALAEWVARIRDCGHVALAAETTAADEMQAELVGLGLAVGPGAAAYLPLGHVRGSGDLFAEAQRAEGQIPLADALAILRPALEDPAVMKIGHDMKACAKAFARHGIVLDPVDDTLLISYALHAGLHGHGTETLAEAYLGHVPMALKSLTGGGRAAKRFEELAIEDAGRYAAEDAEIAWRLWEALKPRLPFARVTRVYETMERPLLPVLADMERHGIKVDRAGAVAALGRLRPEDGGHRGRDLPPGRRAVQHRLAEAARRGALRPDGARRRAQGQDRRLRHRRRRAGGARRPGARPGGAGARLAAGLEAEVDLHRHPAVGDQPRDRAGAHLLHHRRRRHRPARLDRPEPAEHPDPHRGGPAHPRGVHRRAGPPARQPRLQPDRAPHPRPHRRHPGAHARPSSAGSTSTP